MPKREGVEQFKEVLSNVGEESKILSQKGQSKPEVQPPKKGDQALPWDEAQEILKSRKKDDLEEIVENPPQGDSFLDSSFQDLAENNESDQRQEEEERIPHLLGEDDSNISDEDSFSNNSFLDEMDSIFKTPDHQDKYNDSVDLENLFSEDNDFSSLFDESPFAKTNPSPKDSHDLSFPQGVKEENSSDDLSFLENSSEESSSDLGLTDKEYKEFNDKLNTLPKNLRLAVAEVIVKPDLGDLELISFMKMVIREKNFKKIARVAGEVLGKVIILPHSYYKAREEELKRQNIWYNIFVNTWPILKKGLLLNAIVFLFLFVSFYFVLEPWQANSYFKEGLALIKEGKSEEANEFFQKGYYIKSWDEWFLKYALAFEEQRDFENAILKYEQLLTFEPFALGSDLRKRTKFSEEGYLAYASFRNRQGDFEEAELLLREAISGNVKSYDAWLLRGDNFMDWAKLNPSFYPEALNSYIALLELYGDSRPESLFRILNFYIETDAEVDANNLYNYIEDQETIIIDPITYTKYAAYLLEKDNQVLEYMKRKAELLNVGRFSLGQEALIEREYSFIQDKDNIYLSDIGNLLRKSIETDPSYIPAYYYISHYFSRSNDQVAAKEALETTIKQFYLKGNLTAEEKKLNILSYRDLGYFLEREEEYIKAREYYQKGIELYEDQLSLGVLSPDNEFSKLLVLQGDSYYRFYEDSEAKFFYEKAIEQGFVTPEISYSMANIFYGEKDYLKAIESLFNIESIPGFRVDPNVLYAMGNSLADNQDLESSRGYYLQLLDILGKRRGFIEAIDFDNEDHKYIIEMAIQVYNNLGVVEMEIAEGFNENPYFAKGIRHLIDSTELFDVFYREEETKVKNLDKDLASLNLTEGWKGSDSLIKYQSLPRYLESGRATW